MEFESPDVEKEFPGLYASQMKDGSPPDGEEDGRESGRRRDRRDRKDKGYAALSGDSSPEKDHRSETKSPTRSSKKKAFKFATPKAIMKDRRDKSRPRNTLPVFGVDLDCAVRRSPCLDGVAIPLPVRHALDCLRERQEQKVQATPVHRSILADLKSKYDARNLLSPPDNFCVTIAWELLRHFLTHLPHPLLQPQVATQLQNATTQEALQRAVDTLPEATRTTLAWLVKHIDVLEARQCSAQAVATAMRIPQALLVKLHENADILFRWCRPERHVPPLVASGTATPPLPEHPQEMADELARQERLLALIHADMSEGLVGEQREEQLWCVSRLVTQLKRKIRLTKLQLSEDTNMLLTHSTHPEAEELMRLQLEHKYLTMLAERLHSRTKDALEELVELTKEDPPPVAFIAEDEPNSLEILIAENLKLLATMSTLQERIHEGNMENIQLQVDAAIEHDAIVNQEREPVSLTQTA
ncbi:hypothetical protein DMENIID0001_155730 [Sergentomyia squamirostris]